MLAEFLGDCGEVCGALPREAVAQVPISVSGVGEIEAGFTFKNRVAARNALTCQTDCQQRIAHSCAFAHGTTAAAGTFEVTRSQVDTLGKGTVDLVRIQTHDLRDGSRGTKNTEQRTSMKSARQDGRDEIRGQAFHDLVAGHHASQKLGPSSA